MFQPTAEQVHNLTQNMSDLELIGDFEKYPRVEIKPCTENFESFIEPNQCYLNAFRIMAELHVKGVKNAYYVAGITWGYNLPICHAWIKIDGVYYDPTLEKSLKLFYGERYNAYFSIAELNMQQLSDVTMENEAFPPHPALFTTRLTEFLQPATPG